MSGALPLLIASLLRMQLGASPLPDERAAEVQVGPVVDRVVALVEGRVLTLSELEFEARVALVQRGALQAATAPLDEAALRTALDFSIGQRLQLLEAERLNAVPLEPEEVESALRVFRARFPSHEAFEQFLARQEVELSSLRSLLAGWLRAQKFLDSKVRLRAQVSEGEVRRYYDENSARLGAGFAEVRPRIREKMFRERYNELVAAELSQARKSADVRLVAPLARPKGEAGG